MTLKPADLQWSPDGRLVSSDYGDIYFQPGQGAEESHYVFLQHNNIPERFSVLRAGDECRIAELGFGTGLNFLLTATAWKQGKPPGARLHYVSIEKHPIRVDDLRRIYQGWPAHAPITDHLLRQYPPLIAGFHHIDFPADNIRLTLLLGDVADVLPELSGAFDAWYLDGFSPAKNPAMWDQSLFPLIAERTRPGGTLATFSAAGHVRRGLEEAGFDVQRTKGFGHKEHMTVAKLKSGTTAPVATRRPSRVAVLGAGLAGAGVARALAARNISVTVYDRAPASASEASGNPVGILYPKMTVDPSSMGAFHQHGFCFTRQMLLALDEPSWQPCGVTHLDVTDEDRHRTQNLFAKNEYPADYAAPIAGGYHQAMAGHVSPAKLCARLLDHPMIRTVYDHSVSALEDIEADAVVAALGNASRNFAQTEWMEIQSLRGQISYLPHLSSYPEISSVICHDGYVTPAIDGIHYVGATFSKEPPGDTAMRAVDHAENIRKLCDHVPGFNVTEKDVTGGRVGFRATTPDKIPLIGPCPDAVPFRERFAGLRTGKKVDDVPTPYHPGLYISSGFGAHGLSGALLAGDIVAALITGGVCPVPASLLPAMLPERFLIRDLKRRKV